MNPNNYLRSMRKERGVTQMEVAVRAGVSQSVLVACERYSYLPTLEVRQRIAAVLECDWRAVWPEIDGADHKAVSA